MSEEMETGYGTAVAVLLIVCCFLAAGLLIYFTSAFVGKSTRDQVINAVGGWDERTDAFQYSNFRIFDIKYDGINDSVCALEKVRSGEKTFYNASVRIAFDKDYMFMKCDVLINFSDAETLVERFLYDSLKTQQDYGKIIKEGLYVSLGKLRVTEDYSISVNCDGFVNRKEIPRLCNYDKN